MDQTVGAELCNIEFGIEVMMIEQKALAPWPEEEPDEKYEIGRIAGVNHIESMPPRYLDRQAQFVIERAGVLEEITYCTVRFVRQGVAIDVNSVDLLMRCQGIPPHGADDAHLVASRAQR